MTDIPCVGAIVFDDDGRLLLIKRAHEPAIGKWSIPGGRVEAGESFAEAVVREVLEETNLTVTVGREVGTVVRELPSGDRYVIRDFIAFSDGTDALRAGDDAAAAAFIAPDDLDSFDLTPGLVEALTEWRVLPPQP